MLPSGPLMIEHRLIERVIALAQSEARRIDEGGKVDAAFAASVVDFMRTYADRTHHGKEEDILFRVLAEMDISDEDRALMDELIREHERARSLVGSLESAARAAAASVAEARAGAVQALSAIAGLYPEHIRKEDERFFPAAVRYLSAERRQTMLEEFADFDREMIHERYGSAVESLEDARGIVSRRPRSPRAYSGRGPGAGAGGSPASRKGGGGA
jgi:hemerythrin-like domain-containing protein